MLPLNIFLTQLYQQYRMNFSRWIVLWIVLASTYCQQAKIIDFTYTQLLQEAGSTGDHTDKINIFPDSQVDEQYEFPEVCQLQAKLQEGTASAGAEVSIFNVDDHLTTLRQKILYLLRLAEKIKKSKANLQQIKDHLELKKEKGNVSKFSDELSQLAEEEADINNTKGKIEELTFKLNQIIGNYNDNPKNQQFKKAALNFQIYSYQAKIDYLNQLKEKTKRKIDQQERINYTDFFQDLQHKLYEQSDLIVSIDQILTNFSDVNYLKSKIAGLQSKIQASNLYIQEKQNCIIQKDKARKKNSHQEIKQTMEKLRQKKKQFGNTPNKYCQGVAQKLQNQIKKLLKVFNLTYSCAEGLEDLEADRYKELRELEAIRNKVRLIEDQGFDKYQRKYNDTRDDIKYRLQQMKSFTINQYVHNISQIDDLVAAAKIAKARAQEDLLNLPKTDKSIVTINQLRDLVNQIKLEKAKYCGKYDKYERRVHELWKKIQNFQDREIFSAKMRSIYVQEAAKLRELEQQFKKSSEDIIGILAK